MSTARPPQTVAQWIRWATREFERAQLVFGHGTDNAADEAAWIMVHVLQIDFVELANHYERAVASEHAARFRGLIEQRIATRKPTAYLLNEAWFAGLRFYVDERVLVPRSLFGEFIAEQFQPWLDPGAVHRALDLCTGSGCMAVALAQAFPDAKIDASDISAEALAVARMNIERHGVTTRVTAIASDLFAKLSGPYDLIVSNPPYVDAATMRELAPEFQQEPALALASGVHGLDHPLRILARAADFLTPTGNLFMEVGNSCGALQARFPSVPFTWLTARTGDESVFLLSAADLKTFQAEFRAACA